MQIFNDLNIKLNQPAAVAVGYFDGVHRGHRAVIQAALQEKAHGLSTTVFSFSMQGQGNSPMSKKGAMLLQSPTLKERAIAELGVDTLICPPFSSFMGMTPSQYAVDLLIKTFNARVVCCGYDYRFGKGASAGSQELGELLAPYGVTVKRVEAVLDEGEPISSTRIRDSLQGGDVTTVARLLGRPYSIDFPVTHGNALGSRLGFPTANQPIEAGFGTPRFGVYATNVIIDGKSYSAVTNVGVKPTVGSDFVCAESYISGFSGDLYGKRIETRFIEFLRPEKRFDSLEELKAAIAKDAERALTLVKP